MRIQVDIPSVTMKVKIFVLVANDLLLAKNLGAPSNHDHLFPPIPISWTSYEATDLKNKTWIVILGWLGYYCLLSCLLKLNYWKISEFLPIQNVQCMIIVNKCFLSSFRYSKVIYQCMIIFFFEYLIIMCQYMVVFFKMFNNYV